MWGRRSAPRLSRRERRHCDELVNSVRLPTPWSLDELLHQLGRDRGRPILVDQVPDLPSHITAMWVATADADVVFHAPTLSTLFREVAVLHEVGHMLAGDDKSACSTVSDQDRETLLGLPELSECRGAALTILTRQSQTRIDDPAERRAEYIGQRLRVLADARRPAEGLSPLATTMRRTLGAP